MALTSGPLLLGVQNLEALISHLEAVARLAGQYLIAQSKEFDFRRVEYKGLNDLVSYVDKSCEELIVEYLYTRFPSVGFITEEQTLSTYDGTGAPDLGEWFIIDPLDGTTNFIHGLPVFAVSIGYWAEGQVQAGVVYEPNRDECFSAYKGGGAVMNGKTIRVSQGLMLSDSLLATGFPFAAFEDMDAYLAILATLMQQTHGLRRMGSAAVDLCYTACGRFQGFFEYNLKPWDVAAGVIIVREAGGQIGSFDGISDPIFGRQIIAAAPEVFPDFVKVIAGYWAKR